MASDHLGGVGLGARPERPDDAAVGTDEELLEVPLDISGLALRVGGLGELGVQGVPVVAVDVGLLQQQRERDAVSDEQKVAISSAEPGSCPANWLQGTRRRSDRDHRTCRRASSSAVYCG